MDKKEFFSLSVSERWFLFRDTKDSLLNIKIGNEILRAKLEKAEAVIVAAKKYVKTFGHAEDCDIEIKHDDEESDCTCGYSWFEDALKNLEETK